MITRVARNTTAKPARVMAPCTSSSDMMSTRTQVKRAVLERISWRGIERLFGLSRRTVADWIEYCYFSDSSVI
jgi:hypothetical protein